MLTLLIAVAIVVIASGLCSGTEAALFSISLTKAQQLAQSNRAAGRAVLRIRQNMTRPIAALVVLTNLANIVGSIIVGSIATHVLGNQWLGVFSAVLTLLIIIFSEIIPKTLGERHCQTICLITARPMLTIAWLLTPIIWCLEKVTLPITKQKKPRFTTNEAEIKLLATIGQKEGALDSLESQLIRRTFDLDTLTAKDLMTPRVAMTYFKADQNILASQQAIIDAPHSRIIIVNDTPDDVVGVALKDELLIALIEQRDITLKKLTHQVHLVPETQKADHLLNIFQTSRQHLAVVIDEYGGVCGVVTLEDVLEVLIGEIVDETDSAVDLQQAAKAKHGRQSR